MARPQLVRLGVSSRVVDRLIRDGFLIPVHRSVYLVGHTATPPLAEEMASVLCYRGKAAVSHESAGAIFRIVRRPAAVHLTIERRVRPRPGIALHYSPLAPGDMRRHERIPVTSPARTLLDLASLIEYEELERAAAEAWARRIVTRSELQAQVDGHPHRPGTPALRDLLALDRHPARTRSKAERLLLRLIRNAGLPDPETNVLVGRHEVDCLWRAQRFVVEFDSWTFHSSRRSFERDRRKDADLLALGHRVLRLTWRRLTREPDAVIALIGRALAH